MSSESKPATLIQENLADLLTLSRIIIAVVIVALSFMGKDAYITVIILTFIGGLTDIFDGKAARHYLGEGKQGRLGKYDVEVDIVFVLSILAYFAFSEIVVSRLIGFGWICLALVAVAITRRNMKTMLAIEISTVMALLAIAGIYDLHIFLCIIVPVIAAGILINLKRVLYLSFKYWPDAFSH